MGMFSRNNWNNQKKQGILSGGNPVPPSALPIIHELVSQDIQGGAPGEHYHLTEAQHNTISSFRYEPAIICCEELFDGNGEIVMMAVPV